MQRPRCTTASPNYRGNCLYERNYRPGLLRLETIRTAKWRRGKWQAQARPGGSPKPAQRLLLSRKPLLEIAGLQRNSPGQ